MTLVEAVTSQVEQDKLDQAAEDQLKGTEFETLLSPEEAAAIISVTPGTLAVWRSTKRYKLLYLKIGGRVMYRPSDIREFLNKRLITPQVVQLKG